MEIPKFIKGVAKYFTYASDSGETTPTTQADLQELMKNNNTILECLVDGLWQPGKEMKLNQIVRSPNMPANTVAKVTSVGVTGTTEPEWPETVEATVSDGSVTFTMESQQANIKKNIIVDLIYPVGQIVEYASNINPNDLYSWQTWEQIKDVFTLAAGDKYMIGDTGGAATVTLTIDQIPAHGHTATASNDGEHIHSGVAKRNVNWQAGSDWTSDSGNLVASEGNTDNAGGHSHKIEIQNTGGDAAHNNMPPYLVTIKWKRTS